jgi:hypothetical protein
LSKTKTNKKLQLFLILKVLCASYEVSLPTATGRNPHTTAHELIPPAAKVITSRILGCTAENKYII